MRAERSVLAFDYGASGGRAMLCRYDGEKMALSEVHRFSNDPVSRDGTLYWNLDALFAEMCAGIEKARAAGGFESIGVDTWGVDFGLLGPDGALLDPPVHYRDARTNGLSDEVCKLLGERALYEATGTQRMDINTLFQLYALKKQRPAFLAQANCLLPMPDLFAWLLTGERHAELTIASTTQMLNLGSRTWNTPLLEKLGLPTNLLPPLVAPGTRVGTLKKELCEKLGVPAVPVVAVASHDTASAVLAVPAREHDFIFISCGTWSLFGTERGEPVVNETSLACNLTNELGFGGKVTFLKNIIGLWLIQETRRQFRREGREYTYAQMETMARKSRPFLCFIDPDAPEFVPAGDIPGRIREFCRRTGQEVPQTDGEIVRCIYESLAFKYRSALEQVEACTGIGYNAIYLVGGGTKDGFLCGMTADATGLPVTAGPIEATAMGNAAAQLAALGELGSFEEARGAIRRSFEPKKYLPAGPEAWSARYGKIKPLFVKKQTEKIQ